MKASPGRPLPRGTGTMSPTSLRRGSRVFGAMPRLASALGLALAAFIAQPDSISLAHARGRQLGPRYDLLSRHGVVADRACRRRRDARPRAVPGPEQLPDLSLRGQLGLREPGGHRLRRGTIKELSFWPRTWHLALTVAALLSSWLLIQTVFAFHYARRYDDRARPGSPEPAELLPGLFGNPTTWTSRTTRSWSA